MNSDRSPELLIFLESFDSDPEEFALGFSVNNLKSMSRISHVPALTLKQEAGYNGRDKMALVKSRLVRRFPIYIKQGNTWEKRENQDNYNTLCKMAKRVENLSWIK